MHYKTKSWRKVIDPHFNKIVKQYTQFLDGISLPSSSGWIVFEDNALTEWQQKNMPGWIKDHEKKVTKARWQKFINLRQDGIPKKGLTGTLKGPCKDLSQSISMLPKESQEYYQKVFTPFSTEKAMHEFAATKTKEEILKAITDYVVDLACLEMHIASIMIEQQAESTPEEFQKQFSRLPVMIGLLLSAYESISCLVNRKGFNDLLKEGKKGDEKAFFALLKIDRTVVECEWAQKMIRKAQLAGNKEFFKQMADAISIDPLDNAIIRGQASIVILIFWKVGLYRLVNKQLKEFLEDCGINVQDEETLRKFVSRLIPADKRTNILPFSFSPENIK
jgi:hypothetical protein